MNIVVDWKFLMDSDHQRGLCDCSFSVACRSGGGEQLNRKETKKKKKRYIRDRKPHLSIIQSQNDLCVGETYSHDVREESQNYNKVTVTVRNSQKRIDRKWRQNRI